MNKSNDLLKGILDTIENGLRKDINSDTLAENYNYSTRHLERIFKYAFNVNLGSYIRSRKLATSLDDLLRTDEKVLYIALEYCFDFEQSYIRSFKREFGITPGEFRKSGRVVKITPPLRVSDANKLTDEILSEQEIDIIPQLYIVGGNSYGNVSLPETPYGYEVWTEKGNNNKFIWYGAEERGKVAFRAEWNNPEDFIARIGYYWNEGKSYKEYKDVFCDFMFERSANGTAGDFSYIGVYGWTRNPIIEWYIVEDTFGYENFDFYKWNVCVQKMGEIYADEGKYFIYKAKRINKPSIDGMATYDQYFSIRQTRRQKGTISVYKHFKEWEKIGMPLGNNICDVKFFVDAGGGKGWFDAKYASLYTKADECPPV